MENLNKENFWNEMKEKYPVSVGKFCEWVDKYKEENKWRMLFQEHHNSVGIWQFSPKYHELPLAMQIGIFSQWFLCIGDGSFTDEEYREHCRSAVIDMIVDMEEFYAKGEQSWPQGSESVPGE